MKKIICEKNYFSFINKIFIYTSKHKFTFNYTAINNNKINI